MTYHNLASAMRIHPVRCFLLFCLLPPMAAQGEAWRSLSPQSRLGFTSTWEGAEFGGTFQRFSVTLQLDPQAAESGPLEVKVDVTSARTGIEEVDAGMGEPLWFDYARFPQAQYVAKRIRALGGGRFEAEGELNIKGVTKAVPVPFTWTQGEDRANMTGQLELNRGDFRVGEGEWKSGDAIGLGVKVSFEVHLAPGN